MSASTSQSIQQVGAMLKQNNEVGSGNKPPMYMPGMSYSDWRQRFESYVGLNDPEMMVYLEEKYERPLRTGVFNGPIPEKSIKSMTPEERKAFDMERKTHSAITMALPQPIMRQLRQHKIAYDLWRAFEKKCGGSDQYKKKKIDLIKKQYEVFDMLQDESLEDLCSRYSQLVTELLEGGVTLERTDVNKKLLDSLPKKWQTRVLLMERDEDIMDMELEDLIGHIEAELLEMQRKETKATSHLQNPKLYGVDVPVSASKATGTAFVASKASGTGSTNIPSGGSYFQNSGNSTSRTEEYSSSFSAFLASAGDFNDEDFGQIDQEELERLDLKWNMAMLTRRVKSFLKKSGRTSVYDPGEKDLGFNKSKVKCYKTPSSGLTKPSPVKAEEKAMVSAALMLTETPWDNSWPDAAEEEEEEEEEESALMAEVHEVDDEPLSCVSCIKLTNKFNRCREDNERLNANITQLTESNEMLRESYKASEKKLNARFEEKKELKAKIFEQQDK